MANVTMTLEEYEALRSLISSSTGIPAAAAAEDVTPGPPKRTTAYQRRYKKSFKKMEKRYKLKSGKWKKGGFKAAVRAAHKEARK